MRKVASWEMEDGSGELGVGSWEMRDGSRNQQTPCSEKFRRSPDCNENPFSFFFKKKKIAMESWIKLLKTNNQKKNGSQIDYHF